MTFAIPRADINLCAARARELNTNVAGCAKAVYAQTCAFPFTKPRQAQTAMANYAGAKQWRCLNVFEIIRYVIGKRGWRNSIFRISTIHTPAGKQRLFAK